MLVRRTWFSWRPFLAMIALLVPFCACHFVLLLGSGDGCCLDGRGDDSSLLFNTRVAVPEPVPVDPPSRESACGSPCCRRDATHVSDRAPTPAPSDVPSDPETPSTPLPGCGSDTCCVKSVPQEAPWQLPPALLVTIVDLEAAVPHGLARLLAIEWPPTLPLGQPPTPFDRGTLLLV